MASMSPGPRSAGSTPSGGAAGATGRRGQRQPRRRRIAVQQPDLAQGQAVAIHRRQPGAGGRIRHQQHAGAVLQDVTQLHARDAVLIGTATAPSQPQPSTTDRNSIRLPAISATRSPRRTPWAASSAAQRAACAGASPYSSVPPGAWTQARAPWRAAWSISIAGNVCACMLVFPLVGVGPRLPADC